MSHCTEARRAVHLSLDSSPMDAGKKRLMDEHLAGCEDCRAFAEQLREIQGGLRSLPGLKLPDEVLERVWDRTTRRRLTGSRRWGWAAAAAVMFIALTGLWLQDETGPPGPTEAEVAQAAEQARLVLGLTSRALQRTERAVVIEVLTDGVSQALQRLPVRWTPRAADERSGS